MEQLPNINQILLDEMRDLRRIVELSLHQDKVETNYIFNIKGQKKAAKILKISVKTLQNKITEGKMIENIHYRFTISKRGRKRYTFNENALTLDKGLI